MSNKGTKRVRLDFEKMMMTENSYVKMSARRNLSSLLGEPDHEQNKADLAYLNNVFDQQFKSRWGIDPKRDILDASIWQKMSPEEYVPSAYSMPSLEWSCNPKKKCRRTHLGLQGARAGSPVTGKPLGEVNTNSVVPSTDYAESSSVTRPLTPILDNVDSTDLVRVQCESPTPTAECSITCISSSPPCSSSRKRKQTKMNQFFPQKKGCIAKRRIVLQ